MSTPPRWLLLVVLVGLCACSDDPPGGGLDAGTPSDTGAALDAAGADATAPDASAGDDSGAGGGDASMFDGGLDASGLDASGLTDASEVDGGIAVDGGDAAVDDAGATGPDAASCDVCWRSTLYPDSWTPSFTDSQGRFLHDFSYAGYRQGAVALPAPPPGSVFDVVAGYAADPSGASDSTSAIQAAIDAAEAAGGGVVYFPTGLYRCDDVLQVTASRVVLRGDGPAASRIYFTRAANMSNLASITFRGNVTREPDLLLATDGANRSSEVAVVDASSLAVGDSVALGWVISPNFVTEHGMDGFWQPFNGTWRPFFRREITAIDLNVTPHVVTLDVPSRYVAKTRDGASLRRESGYLVECGLESLGISNAIGWDDAWTFNRAAAVIFEGVADGWVRDVRSFASPAGNGTYHLQSGGIRVVGSKRVTVTDCQMEKPQHRGSGGNGYLFEISASSEILIKDSTAIDGRHNFIQNWDFGTTGCVFLRNNSSGGRMMRNKDDTLPLPGLSEYHHSLAMANLVDQCVLADGWFGGNRLTQSSGAGHTVTESAYWNLSGGGLLISAQYGEGYVIGPGDLNVITAITPINPATSGTEPEDFVETGPMGAALDPPSLYEDQLRRRLGP